MQEVSCEILSAVGRYFQARRRDSRILAAAIQSFHPDQQIELWPPAAPPALLPRLEPLETRQLLSASINSAGWTVVTPPPGARVIYVSTQGNDKNSGLSSSTPVKTVAHGVSLLRNNSADELLLQRGDTWGESLGFWKLSGISPQAPILIGAYGSGARPTLATGNSYALEGGGASISNLDIIGIHMYPNARKGGGPDGVTIDSKVNNILIENCDIEDYRSNIVFEKYFGAMSNVTIRRSIISNSWSGDSSHSQGLYLDGVNGITLQDNVFDHDGWNNAAGGWATIFNHDVYVTAYCSGLVATDNIFSNASNFGLEARCGGTIENNLFYNDADGMEFGLVDGSPVTPGGVSGSIIGNVFMGSHAIGSTTYGNGLLLGNINSKGVVVSNNLFDNEMVGKVPAIELEVPSGNSNFNSAVGLNNVKITGNVVYNWYQSISVQSGLHSGGTGPYAINNVQISGNRFGDIHNPTMGATYPGVLKYTADTATGFPAPSRSLAGYAASIGVGSSDAALLAAAGRSSATWTSSLSAAAVTQYLLAGFALGSSAPASPAGPSVGPAVASSPAPSSTLTPTPAPTFTSSASLPQLVQYAKQESASNRSAVAYSALPGAVRKTFKMETLGTKNIAYYSFAVNGVTLYSAHYDIGSNRTDCRVSAAGQLLGKVTLTGTTAATDRAAAARVA